jgi:2-polyprenyl-6-methoxyphenol hydroxylase-like FAD-dependent oxidoreductase
MLQPTGMAVLAELGLAKEVLALGRRIDRMFGRVLPSNRIILDVTYRRLGPQYSGLAVHRAALFDPLFAAVQKRPIPIETGQDITGIEYAAGGRPCLTFAGSRRSGPFDLVVDALGVRSPLGVAYRSGPRWDLPYGALWASLPWPAGPFHDHTLEQRYERASTMIGVLPIGKRAPGGEQLTAFFWSIKPDDYDIWKNGGLKNWKARAHALWPETAPLLEQIVDAEQLTLARYSHHTIARPIAGRVVAIGDSAHAASPQLGQGANMALLDARALSLALALSGDGAGGIEAALARYAALRRWHVRFYQALSAAFTPFYQSDSRLLPALRDWVVAPGTRLPLARTFVAGTVAGIVLDPRIKLGLRKS